jgi:hypothetical protein
MPSVTLLSIVLSAYRQGIITNGAKSVPPAESLFQQKGERQQVAAPSPSLRPAQTIAGYPPQWFEPSSATPSTGTKPCGAWFCGRTPSVHGWTHHRSTPTVCHAPAGNPKQDVEGCRPAPRNAPESQRRLASRGVFEQALRQALPRNLYSASPKGRPVPALSQQTTLFSRFLRGTPVEAQ